MMAAHNAWRSSLETGERWNNPGRASTDSYSAKRAWLIRGS